MTMLRRLFSRVAASNRGSVTIETAIVAPVLVLMALGGFDVSEIIARQTELDSAAAEGAAIVRAKAPSTTADLNTIRDIIKTSIDRNNTDPYDTVTVTQIYRCGTTATYVTANNCATGDKVSTYVKVVITDKYKPVWTNFGVGHLQNYNVNRVVQIS
ncbi:MAG: TadE/TadG family type IV pilus assembly protein [Croceibacterium sp.]